MSTTAEAVFDRSPYEAPTADLSVPADAHPDRLFSYKNRIGVMRFNARIMISMMTFMVGIAMFGAMSQLQSTVAVAVTGATGAFLLGFGIRLFIYSAIKRLHDHNLTGWFYLLGMVPVLGALWFLGYALKPSSNEDNKFGPALEATMVDKVLGTIGIIFIVAITVASFLPMANY